MKFIDEYRSSDIVKLLSEKIHSACKGKWTIMEVCGGQTHSILKYGLEELLPDNISILHGPGCPVCVTPLEIIDKAICLSLRNDTILVSYGDMLRVPGTEKNLLCAKAEGADIRIVYSPVDAVNIAETEKNKNVIFFAIGFETTAPANGMALMYAKNKKLSNFFMLSSHMLVLPAVELILSSAYSKVQGLLAPGHVCTITGYEGFCRLSEKFKLPVAVTGFEPVDILQGILLIILLLENEKYEAVNQYSRSVKKTGNLHSVRVLNEVFEIVDRNWRGIGMIPQSGLKIRREFAELDAEKVFDMSNICSEESPVCIAGQILQGLKRPSECPAFEKNCTPEKPLGAPMVSAEGICAAYYKFGK